VRAESRKRNKAVIEGTRVDLTLVADRQEEIPERGPFRKLGRIEITAVVTDASAGFDHPARYRVRHDDVAEVVSFTPTYAGQVLAGETIHASGWLEVDAAGARRLVVGTSREARGEYVVVTSRGSCAGPRC
jgi:predicted nucleotidyltransferase